MSENNTSGKKLLSGVVLGLLLTGLTAALLFFKGFKAPEPIVTTPVVEEPKIDSAALVKPFVLMLADSTIIDAAQGSLEDQVVVFLSDTSSVVSKDKWFDFDNLLFETGKATLMPESGKQLGNLSTILNAFPKVKIKLGGYTDNVGDPKANLKLSGDRAASVMAELVKSGIDASRLQSEGYGEQWPVGSNDTEEGRAKNRRISMRVTEL
ncbi:MAG: OmpA family protein [Cytophagales bacterium]|nr:MAG: OmpA family protein [Cytophagales bacterium]